MYRITRGTAVEDHRNRDSDVDRQRDRGEVHFDDHGVPVVTDNIDLAPQSALKFEETDSYECDPDCCVTNVAVGYESFESTCDAALSWFMAESRAICAFDKNDAFLFEFSEKEYTVSRSNVERDMFDICCNSNGDLERLARVQRRARL